MTLQPGSKLGPYEILSPLGAGGMGEVYRARDTRLDRDVAIKILPDALARDKERILRFEREAKVLASLNHPNIAAIYGFEEFEGKRLLVMELAEGETLAERLDRGPIPLQDALEFAYGIAVALEAAHEKGIIHRDLKPANVKVTPDGTVKVLDFGLAKAMTGDATGTDVANSPTITMEHTRPGVVLGTAAYMSPEQARGRPLDKRTDIWSFGALLYECLTGRRPFLGETTSDLVAKILEREPDFSLLPANTPPTIRSLLRHCLEKDRKQRYRDIGDAVLELGAAIRNRAWSTNAMMAASSRAQFERRGTFRPGVLIGLLLLALGPAVVTWYAAGSRLPADAISTSHPDIARVSIVVPEDIEAETVRISPDGRVLAAMGRVASQEKDGAPTRMIFVRPLDNFEFRRLPGTEGARRFVYSPEGRWLAFAAPVSALSDQLQFSKVPIDGSTPPLVLAEVQKDWISSNGDDIGMAWASDGIWLMDQDRKALRRMSAETGEVGELIVLGGLSPESFFAIGSIAADAETILLGTSWYSEGSWNMGVAVFDRKAREARQIIEKGSRGILTPTGHILFSRGTKLLAAQYTASPEPSIGAPVAILDGLRTNNSWEDGDYDLSRNGTLVFASGGRVGTRRHLAVVDLDGKIQILDHEPRALEASVAATKDGNRGAVVVVNTSGLYEMWITDLSVPRLRRFAADPSGDCNSAIWSHDNQHLAYVLFGKSARDGIYRRGLSDSGEPEHLFAAGGPGESVRLMSWTPEDHSLIVQKTKSGKSSLYLLPVESPLEGVPRQLKPILPESVRTFGADLSHDGKWLAYSSDESGRPEVYLRAWGGDGTLGPSVGITANGGSSPHWSTDSKHLYYRDRRTIMVVDIDANLPVPASNARVLIDFSDSPLAPDDYSVLPGGKLLLIHKGPDETGVRHVNVVLNWFDELKAKVPTGAQP